MIMSGTPKIIKIEITSSIHSKKSMAIHFFAVATRHLSNINAPLYSAEKTYFDYQSDEMNIHM